MPGWIEEQLSNAGDSVDHAVSSATGGSVHLHDLMNIATNFLTVGFVGYDKEKGFGMGMTSHGYDEAFGEITGRNKAREALNFQREKFDYQKKQAADLLQQQQWYKRQVDISSSDAAAVQRTAGQGGMNMSTSTPMAFGRGGAALGQGAPQKDFLGL